MTRSQRRAAMRTVTAIVRRLFRPDGEAPLAIEAAEWPAVLSALERHRCLGMADAAARAGILLLTAEHRESLEPRVAAWLALSLRAERLAIEAHRTLARAGIEHRFLKGVVYAHTLYPDPSWRHMADADVLVQAEQLPDAVAVLGQELDATRLAPERRPGWDTRFAKDLPLTVDGVELDMHRTIAPGAAGFRIPLDELFAAVDHVTIGGFRLPTLAHEHRAMHARLSATIGDASVRLASRIDAALAASSFDEAWLTRRRHPAEWADSRRWWRELSAVRALDGSTAKTTYLHGLLSPSSPYLRARASST